MTRSSFVVGALVWLAFSGCTTLEKRAKEMLDNGTFEEAVTAYETLSQRDPSNPEYQSGLLQARQGYLSSKLIEVRRIRSAGKASDAADLLMHLMQREEAWAVGPGGNAVATQEEELQLASQFMLGTLRKSVQSDKIFPAEVVLKKYRTIFATRHKSDYAQLVAQNKKRGQEMCAQYARTSYTKRPYVAEFVKVFCGYFDRTPEIVGYSMHDMLEDLLPEIKYTFKIDGAKASEISCIEGALTRSFRETAWFHPKGASKFSLVLSGSYAHAFQKVPTQLVHEYEETEYYASTQRIARHRTVYTGSSNLPTTETYYEEQPIRLSRQVKKYFPYGAWHLIQTATLDLSGAGTLAKQSVTLQQKNSLSESGNSNDMEVASVGLRRYDAALTDLDHWWVTQSEGLAASLKAQLQHLWVETKCTRSSGSHSFVDLGNDVQECLGANPDKAPDFVDQWYIQHFGMDRAAVDGLLKITRKRPAV